MLVVVEEYVGDDSRFYRVMSLEDREIFCIFLEKLRMVMV